MNPFPGAATGKGAIARVLVVDDDPAILGLVGDKLVHSGYDVLSVSSGAEALEVIRRTGMPHLAIVDLNMPGMNGFEFCQQVQAFSDLPVIMLTAVDEEDTIVRALQLFAEDYVSKPFSPRELVARVQRVLRRMGDFAYILQRVIVIDQRLAVEFGRQQATVAGQAVSLTPTETKLLYILMRNAGRTVTSDFLLRRLWPLEEVFEDALRVHVSRLRRKIEEDPRNPDYIITDRGIGYRFMSGRSRTLPGVS